MRRISTIPALIVALVLLLALVGCGDGGTSAAGLEDESPQGILTAAMTAAEGMTSASGTFDVNVTFDADTAQLPEDAKAFVEQPMGLSGALTYGVEPRALDMSMALSLAGGSMEMAVKMLDDKGWLQLGGQWYEGPPELSEMMGNTSASDQTAQIAQMKQALATAGIDPLTWIKDLKLAGEEELDGRNAYHLTGTPDLVKMLTDVMALMQNQEAMKALDPTGSLSGLMGGFGMGAGTGSESDTGDLSAPGFGLDPTMLAGMAQQLAAMFQELETDVWIAKDDLMLLRFTAGAKMVPPPGEDADGLNAVVLDVDLTLKDHNQPVSVEAPAGAQPFSALEEVMENDPASVLGPLSGILGAMGTGFGGASLQ